jgi:hypothetical protein
MDSKSIAFLEVMIGIAVVGLVAFLVLLVVRSARRPREALAEGVEAPYTPRWYEFALALALLVAVVLVLVWQLPPIAEVESATADWRAGSRSLAFLVVMLALAGLGLLAFLVVLFGSVLRGPRRAAFAQPSAGEQAAVETPSAARLLGLLGLALAFLLLNWLYLPREQQYALMLYLIYPASLGVALVLLFDKASRSWQVKTAAETVREWLFCDAIVFLLVLGFLNLLRSPTQSEYAGLFWDFLFLALFFLAFWILDRKVTRYRFLVAYGTLIVLPILLLVWRTMQDVAVPEGLSWWSTVWPFFFLAIIFLVLEVIALVAAREAERHVLPAVKDAVFVALYGILLIVGIPEAAG